MSGKIIIGNHKQGFWRELIKLSESSKIPIVFTADNVEANIGNESDSDLTIKDADVDYFSPSRVTMWWFMHHCASGQSRLMNQVNKTFVDGMTEEKLKCVTGGKHHRSSRTFHFECDDLHHKFVLRHVIA